MQYFIVILKIININNKKNKSKDKLLIAMAMNASSGEQPTNAPAMEESSSDDIHAVPDVELLQFQKQRSTPKVSLSEVNLDGLEVVHCEVEDFGQMSNQTNGGAHLGMAPSGTEEQVIRQLQKMGSLGSSDEMGAQAAAA